MIVNRENPQSIGPGSVRARRIPRTLLLGGILLPMALLLFSCSGCSPVYIARAGWAEMKILKGRRPLDEVINDQRTDEDTRRKLLLARQARAFAIHRLGLDAGDSYTSFTQLETDTLAWVLSAAYKDRLESKTWWFPIVGRVPYKGYASQKAAGKAQSKLEAEGLDTYLRTTSAFSTLGWFADPLLSSLLRYDDVNLVETIIHELSHNHLFVPGKVQFNESFATFVGRVGAIRFFCGPDGTPQNPPECQAAKERWEDYQAFSRFLGEFIGKLETIYGNPSLSVEEKVQARADLLRDYQDRYRTASPPETSSLILSFLGRPLNNATLLARMRYFHRLSDFQLFLDANGGNLGAAVAALTARAKEVDDPFELLPSGS
ncbi:MAG: aminopeptidase [Longimicrobiales bacterium]|nr:aminopeptidase [Longimicrobiales bacterium]